MLVQNLSISQRSELYRIFENAVCRALVEIFDLSPSSASSQVEKILGAMERPEVEAEVSEMDLVMHSDPVNLAADILGVSNLQLNEFYRFKISRFRREILDDLEAEASAVIKDVSRGLGM